MRHKSPDLASLGIPAGELDTSWLDNAIAGDRLGYLHEYPSLQTMLDFIRKNDGRPQTPINIEQLSVNGEIRSEEMENYLADDGVSSSALKEVLKNPASYFFYKNDKANFEEVKKDHFELGTFGHMAFLEADRFKRCKVEPKINRATKSSVINGIEFYEQLKNYDRKDVSAWGMEDLKIYLDELQKTCGYTMVSEKNHQIIKLMERNYYWYGGGIIPKILNGAVCEKSFYYTDPTTGIRLKVRPDALNTAENIGVDAIISFKTTSAPTLGKFIYDSAKFLYELSEGMYQEVVSDVTGRKFNSTIMIMLQTVPPYLPAVFWWAPEDLQNGKYKFRFALDTVADCEENGLWPGFEAMAESGNEGIIELIQPEWSKKLLAPVDVEN